LAKFQPKTHFKLALVGAETLLGKELTTVLEDRPSAAMIVSFAATGEGNFGEADGEAVYREPLESKQISEVRAVLTAGSAEGAQKAYDLVKAAGSRPLLIDCTGHLENQPEARIVSPLAQEVELGESWLLVIAHPMAGALALSLSRLNRYRKIRQAVAHIFEPASERGFRAASELHEQTTSLFAFKPLNKEIFDSQLSFNLLPKYGDAAPVSLSAVEQRIERDLAAILAKQQGSGPLLMPSLRVIAAPVFHGYSLSIWIEFETDINAEEIGEALASAQIEVRDSKQEAPDNVGVAGQSGLIAGDIRVDRNNRRAAWLWIVADNLRLTADAAAELAGKLETTPQ
jgi:aspartate-semialdehyde dehydrogenase